MRMTVELPEEDLEEICRITGVKKKSTAVRTFVADHLMLERRRRLLAELRDEALKIGPSAYAGYDESRRLEQLRMEEGQES